MKLPHLHLRDLLWLVLLAATITAGWREHAKLTKAVASARQEHPFVRVPRTPPPTPEELANREIRQEVARLPDSELIARLAQIYETARETEIAYEYSLSEMSRRKMTAALKEHYLRVMRDNEARGFDAVPRNFEELTALRRAAGDLDPLAIRISTGGGLLRVEYENQDIGREIIGYSSGGSEQRGRNEHWRIMLIDDQGKPARVSNYLPSLSGYKVGPYGHLDFNREKNWPIYIDVKRHIAPPPSGVYHLRLLYHNRRPIAGSHDIAGSIYAESPSYKVVVKNEEPLVIPRLPAAALAVGALMFTFLFGIGVISLLHRRLGWRDSAWANVIFAAALAWYFDQQRLEATLVGCRPDEFANWTLEVLEEEPSTRDDEAP